MSLCDCEWLDATASLAWKSSGVAHGSNAGSQLARRSKSLLYGTRSTLLIAY